VMYTLLNLLGAASMLGTFANYKLIVWREMSAGYSKEAFFFSQNLLDIPQFVVYVLVFWLIYMVLCTPLGGAGLVFIAMLLMMWVSSGMAYAFAVYVNDATLFLVCMVCVLNIICSGIFTGLELPDSNLPFFMSPTRWGLEMITVSAYNKHAAATYPDTKVSAFGWEPTSSGENHWGSDKYPNWLILIVIGLSWRLLAYVGLYICNRGQMAQRPILDVIFSACNRARTARTSPDRG